MTEKKKLRVPKFVQTWIKDVRKTNREFEAASPEKKRVMLARDVLRSLDQERIKAQTGHYVNGFESDSDSSRAEFNEKLSSTGEADEIPLTIPMYGEDCTVCAKGALFVAKVDRLNGVTVGDFVSYADLDPSRFLLDYFSRRQLDLIEAAFERDRMSLDPYDSDAKAAIAFGSGYVSHAQRMRAIMENVIENNGEFRP